MTPPKKPSREELDYGNPNVLAVHDAVLKRFWENRQRLFTADQAAFHELGEDWQVLGWMKSLAARGVFFEEVTLHCPEGHSIYCSTPENPPITHAVCRECEFDPDPSGEDYYQTFAYVLLDPVQELTLPKPPDLMAFKALKEHEKGHEAHEAGEGFSFHAWDFDEDALGFIHGDYPISILFDPEEGTGVAMTRETVEKLIASLKECLASEYAPWNGGSLPPELPPCIDCHKEPGSSPGGRCRECDIDHTPRT